MSARRRRNVTLESAHTRHDIRGWIQETKPELKKTKTTFDSDGSTIAINAYIQSIQCLLYSFANNLFIYSFL